METKPFAPPASVIDLLLDAICVVDAEGRFVFVSAACERIFGYTPEEMIGKAMIEMVAPEDRARTLQAANEIMYSWCCSKTFNCPSTPRLWPKNSATL